MRYPNLHESDHLDNYIHFEPHFLSPLKLRDIINTSSRTFPEKKNYSMDDFSFPAIEVDLDSTRKLPFPHFASSPIWFVPSTTTSDQLQKMPNTGGHRRSFTSVVDALRADEDFSIRRDDKRFNGRGRRAIDEEKMDKLWEDFNEELHIASWNCCKGGREEDERQNESMLELCYMEGSIIQTRRPSLPVMLKVLKNLFLIQKANQQKHLHL